MEKNNKTEHRSAKTAAAIPIVIILLPLLYSFFSFMFADESRAGEPFLEMPDPQYTQCVKDTEYMRHNHWVLLRKIREDVVRHGIRGEISLKNCRNCHTSRVNFCDKCHNATSLTPDCFSCHYYP